MIAFLLTLGIWAQPQTAAARVSVNMNIGIPLFYSESDFPHSYNGRYRTYNRKHYHYHRDSGQWHYGRNHREGLREEARRNREERRHERRAERRHDRHERRFGH